MSELRRRTFLSISGGVVVSGSLGATPALAAPKRDGTPPPTIPAVQAWTAARGQFRLGRTTRIVIPDGTTERLRTTAQVFAEDLTRVAGAPIRIVVRGRTAPRHGDIALVPLENGTDLGPEGYEIDVDRAIEIRGSDPGVFFGTRTLLQWFRQSSRIPAGQVRDWPRYRERGLLVANVPKHFSMTWWEGQIRELSYVKLNMLWLYVGYDTTPFAEMDAIAKFAARHNVTVVPQLNMPDHMARLLLNRPDLQLPGRPQSLDLSNPSAYLFARDLVTPLLDRFDTPFWHSGSDEYLLGSSYDQYPRLAEYARQRYGPDAVPEDVHYGFINDINETVRAHGKTMRVWNDGIHTTATVAVDRDVIIEHWTQWPRVKPPGQLLDEGYRISNSNQDFLYYDPGARHPDPKAIYERFHVGLFQAGQTVPDDHPALLGAKLHLWTLPDVETEEEESDNLAAPLRSLAQICWGSPKPSADYEGFAPLVAALGRAPGFPTPRFRTSPADGATSVPPTNPIIVRFYDQVRPESIVLSLSASGGQPVPGTVIFDAGSGTATFTPAAALAWSSAYNVTLHAATDTAGNSLPGPRTWSFRTAEPPHTGSPYRIWQDTEAPTTAFAEGVPLELGVKFRTDVQGAVTGIRFYKDVTNTGLHVGTLWAADGTKLASATFTDESAAGWQRVLFDAPVPINANTTYIASYFASAGRYSATNDTFAAGGKDSGPLHALRDGVDGGNGVFRFGSTGFPIESYRATNYWVDVIVEA